MRSVLLLAVVSVVACSKPKEDAPSAPQVVAPAPPPVVASAAPKKKERAVFDEIGVPSAPSELAVHFNVPKGTAVNDEAPFRIRWKSSEALENAPDDVAAKGVGHNNGFHITVHPAKGAKVARLLGEVELVVCDVASHSICIPVKREVDLTFVVGGGAAPKPVELQLPSANG